MVDHSKPLTPDSITHPERLRPWHWISLPLLNLGILVYGVLFAYQDTLNVGFYTRYRRILTI